MCGIVGAVMQRNIDVTEILLQCLRKLEYRGNDSVGIAVWHEKQKLQRVRSVGKVDDLIAKLHGIQGNIGIAHTRWATHGKPSENNAHPLISSDSIAVVQNGIVENYAELRNDLLAKGYQFTSETDTEVVAHLLHSEYLSANNKDFLFAVQKTVSKLQGSFAFVILNKDQPDRLIAVRCGNPLVVGIGEEGNFIASDAISLLTLTNKFIYLEEGDIADIRVDKVNFYDTNFMLVDRPVKICHLSPGQIDKGEYKYYMQKEIFEQPTAIKDTIASDFGPLSKYIATLSGKIKKIIIVACGSSYHAAMIGRYWIEDLAGIPCDVEIASEFRYRQVALEDGTLFVTVSQSGETADTLAALRKVKELMRARAQQSDKSSFNQEDINRNSGSSQIDPSSLVLREARPQLAPGVYEVIHEERKQGQQQSVKPNCEGYIGNLTICNVEESPLVRESEAAFITKAGIEMGVASTKAFTTQVVALFLLALTLMPDTPQNKQRKERLLHHLSQIPFLIEQVVMLDDQIQKLARSLINKEHMFFLGRGINYPTVLEGALKMKEISYLHAEAYPAGELKHGPLALITEEIPVIVIAPSDCEQMSFQDEAQQTTIKLFDKLRSNINEVASRGGELIVFTDSHDEISSSNDKIITIKMPMVVPELTPLLYVIPLQLLAYYVADLRGNNVDRPRNLAKSVTVE